MDQLRALVKGEVQNISFSSVAEDQSLIKGGVLDSIGIVDLIVSLQEKLGIEIQLSEIGPENFDSINLIADFVRKRIGNAS